jgi:hypothetical protein
MKLKNYTTQVPASKSITEIEQILISFGADKIMKDYRGDGRVLSIVFQHKKIAYKLPANVEKVFTIITNGKRVRSKGNYEIQAERIAWRVIKDWIQVQLSLIEIGQAEWDQVLLPYSFNGEKTLYEIIKERRDGIAGLLGDSSNIKQIAKEE